MEIQQWIRSSPHKLYNDNQVKESIICQKGLHEGEKVPTEKLNTMKVLILKEAFSTNNAYS